MRNTINVILFSGMLLSTYFLYLSTTPEGYTGIFIFFEYTVHSMTGPLVFMTLFALALIIFNWNHLINSSNKLRVVGLAFLAVLILGGVFLFMTYKRHNRLPWDKRNVLIVVVDTLRADHVSAYGTTNAQTPNIDALAEDGWLFERAFTHIPITLPSHSSLFTGRLPHEVKVYNNRDNFEYVQPTLAELFKENGYKTMAAISLGVLKARFHLNRGFDEYNDELPKNGQWFNRADVITDRGIAWLEENISSPDDNFLMWLHYQDPHEPYNPPGQPPDVSVLLNGEKAGEGNLDSAAWVEVTMTLKPGKNTVSIQNNFMDEEYTLYLMKMGVRGDVKDGPFPEAWRGTLEDAREMRGNHHFNLALERFQNDRFMSNFNGLEFSGLRFSELGGFSTRIPGVPRRYINSAGRMEIENTTGEEKEILLRFKGGANKDLTRVREEYALEVEYSDQEIGRLLHYLRSRGLMDNTIVVFMSDHGEELGEHGRVGHIVNLYTESIQVPLIIRDPDSSIKGRRVAELARIQDIAPTLLDMAGMSIPEYMTGKTLIEHIQRNRSEPRRHYAETFTPEARENKFALIEDNDLAIYRPDAELVRQIEFYNLAEDPMQWVNLALGGQGVENLSSYVASLADKVDSMNLGNVERIISEEREQMLQDLGYLTSGGAQTSLEFVGIPSDAVLDAVVSTARSGLEEVGIHDFKASANYIGVDQETGLNYIHLRMTAPEDSGKMFIMGVRNFLAASVVPQCRQFPLRFTIYSGGEVVRDDVLEGDTSSIKKLYTLRVLRLLSHQPFGATLSPAMELSYQEFNERLSTFLGLK